MKLWKRDILAVTLLGLVAYGAWSVCAPPQPKIRIGGFEALIRENAGTEYNSAWHVRGVKRISLPTISK